MEIIVSIVVVAAVAFMSYKIIKKQRESNEANYPKDNGPLTQEQVKQIVESAPKPEPVKQPEPEAQPFTGFPKSEPQFEPKKKPGRKPGQKSKSAKPQSAPAKTKKTKKTQ